MDNRHSFIRHLCQWVSFRAAYIVSLMVLFFVLGWAFVDAHFWKLMGIVEGFIGIEPPHVDSFSTAWKWYGARLLILSSSIAVSVLAAAIVALRLFVGTKRDRSLLSWMLVTLLLGIWGGVLLGVARYPDAQLRYRLTRDMWRFQVVANAITAAGQIPSSARTEIGEVRRGPWDTDRWSSFFVPDSRRSIHENVEKIWTLDDGALLFTLYPSRVALEFHPRGTRPGQRFSKYKFDFDATVEHSFEDLGDGWFLVRRDQP